MNATVSILADLDHAIARAHVQHEAAQVLVELHEAAGLVLPGQQTRVLVDALGEIDDLRTLQVGRDQRILLGVHRLAQARVQANTVDQHALVGERLAPTGLGDLQQRLCRQQQPFLQLLELDPGLPQLEGGVRNGTLLPGTHARLQLTTSATSRATQTPFQARPCGLKTLVSN